MKDFSVSGLGDLYSKLRRRHGLVEEAVPAVMNGMKGFLGLSRLVYWRVWFDYEEESQTLFSSVSKAKASARFKELKIQYGMKS